MMQLTKEQRSRVTDTYEDWVETKRANKARTQQSNDQIKALCESLNLKPSEVRKAFAFAKLQEEKGDNELDAVVSISTLITGE